MLNLALSVASALLLIGVFPRFDASWLAPFALAPLLVAMAREPRWKRRWCWSWIAGIVYWFGVCYWIQAVLDEHGGLPTTGSWASFMLFCAAKGLHTAAFGVAAGWLMQRWWAAPAVSALWAGLERTHGELGFAWLALGNAGVDMEIPMRLAPITGVYGLSFVFALSSALVSIAVLGRRRRELAWALLLVPLIVLSRAPQAQPAEHSVTVVQPNVAADMRWTVETAGQFKQRLTMMSLESALQPGPRPELILWPEVPAPLYLYDDPRLRAQVQSLARVTGAHVLLGTVAHTADLRPLNSAAMVAPTGVTVDRYDKVNLVPFGEFIPPLFGFVDKISSEAGDFKAGTRVVVFSTGRHRVGAFICYESVFPHHVRQFVAQGAEVLVNLSNDGYFSRSAAQEQHLKIVRMRAAENRRWILRATNDGITAAIDPAGRVVERLASYTALAARAGFSYLTGTTLYTRSGDWFAWGCLGASVLLLLRETPWYRWKR